MKTQSTMGRIYGSCLQAVKGSTVSSVHASIYSVQVSARTPTGCCSSLYLLLGFTAPWALCGGQAHSPAGLCAVLALAYLIHSAHPELIGSGWSQATHSDACHLWANI